MANFNLEVDSTFKPFSYQELLAPVIAATQAHRELEDKYSEFETKAGIWENMLDKNLDKNQYEQYSKYMEGLKASADALAKNGLSATSRRNMLNMKRRYSQEIAPIEVAYAKREADIKRQKDISDRTGGKVVFSRDANSTSLDDYMGNVQDFSQINLDDLMKEGMVGGKAISSRYFRSEEGKAFSNEYFKLTTKQGYTSEEAMNILNDPRKYPEFNKFINDTLDKYGANPLNSKYGTTDTNRIVSSLYQGINSGIMYDQKEQFHDDWMSKMYAQAAAAASKKGGSGSGKSSSDRGYRSISHLKDSGNHDTLSSLFNKLYVANDKGDYVGRRGAFGSAGVQNPIRIRKLYDAALKEAEKEVKKKETSTVLTPGTVERKAREIVADQLHRMEKGSTRINPDDIMILSDSDIRTLRKYGFNENSKGKDIMNQVIGNIAGESKEYTEYLLTGDIKKGIKLLSENSALNSAQKYNSTNYVTELNKDFDKTSEKVDYSDFLELLKDEKITKTIGYSGKFKDKIIVTLGGRMFAVDADLIDNETRNAIMHQNSGRSESNKDIINANITNILESHLTD